MFVSGLGLGVRLRVEGLGAILFIILQSCLCIHPAEASTESPERSFQFASSLIWDRAF